jgi:hypothetical protein
MPLAFASGHGRYIAATRTPEWKLASVSEFSLHIYIYIYNRYKFVTTSLTKRLHNGRYTS